MTGRTWAIIPVKPLSEGKRRLGRELTDEARGEVTVEMLDAVMRAARGARGLEGWVVVSRDDSLLARAHAMGGACLAEQGRGLNRALEQASRWCSTQGADAVLVLHGDLPLLRTSEVEEMLESAAENRCLVLAPSRDGTGTNGLLARPPDLVRFSFGSGSLARHLAAAERQGVTPRVFYSVGTAHDVDTPVDLRRWRREPTDRLHRGAIDRALRQTMPPQGAAG